MTITIENHGPLIVATNFWNSPLNASGQFYASCHAGCIRVLVPDMHREVINECRMSVCGVCLCAEEGIELFFDTGPFTSCTIQVGVIACDVLPDEPKEGAALVVSLWTGKKGVPHKSLERKCFWKRVPKLPCVRAWVGQPIPGDQP